MNQVIWQSQARGLEAALSLQNLSLGAAVLFLARVLAILYFINDISDDQIEKRARKALLINAAIFLVFFLFFVVRLMFLDGYSYDPASKKVELESFKYFHNLIEMPWVLVILLLGVVGVLTGIAKGIFSKSIKGIWYAGMGTVLTVLALFFLAGFNNTSFYPSSFDLQSSLTIENSSSSEFTLTVMSYVSLLVPFVFAYIWYVWKSMNKTKIDKAELESEDHLY